MRDPAQIVYTCGENAGDARLHESNPFVSAGSSVNFGTHWELYAKPAFELALGPKRVPAFVLPVHSVTCSTTDFVYYLKDSMNRRLEPYTISYVVLPIRRMDNKPFKGPSSP